MKHLIFTLCTLFACIYMANAQVTISTSDLKGTKWQLDRDYDNNSKVFYEYTQEAKIRHYDDGSTYAYPYYLSNTIPTKFDYTKVGRSTKGCYYIEIIPLTGEISCFTIKNFNKTRGEMILKLEDKNYIESTNTYSFILIPSSKPRGSNSKPYESNW